MLIVLGNNLSSRFRDYFNVQARDKTSGIEIVPASINVFNSGRPGATREPYCELWYGSPPEEFVQHLDQLKGQPVTILQSTSGIAGEAFTELLITIRTLKRYGAGKITVAMPYAWGARQDRPFVGEGRMASVAGEDAPFLLHAAGAEGVILDEMHSKASQDFYVAQFGAENVTMLSSTDLFIEDLKRHPELSGSLRVDGAPDGADKGADFGQRRALEFVKAARGVMELTADEMRTWMFRLAKERKMTEAGKTKSRVIEFGDNSHVAGKICAMIDDMGDSCSTIIDAGEALMNLGAAGLWVYLSHWVGDAPALERLLSAEKKDSGAPLVDRVILTDTAPGIESDIQELEKKRKDNGQPVYPDIHQRVTVLETAPMFAKKIKELPLLPQ